MMHFENNPGNGSINVRLVPVAVLPALSHPEVVEIHPRFARQDDSPGDTSLTWDWEVQSRKASLAENDGMSEQQGGFVNGGLGSVFKIAHGLIQTPAVFAAIPLSEAAQAPHDVSAGATHLIITFVTAPANGADLVWRWMARVA